MGILSKNSFVEVLHSVLNDLLRGMLSSGRMIWLHARVFTKFRILEISYISHVFLNFVFYSKVATVSRK